jgi:DNA/RNA-binding domain of Phe-tRNA-synthetase-like protein
MKRHAFNFYNFGSVSIFGGSLVGAVTVEAYHRGVSSEQAARIGELQLELEREKERTRASDSVSQVWKENYKSLKVDMDRYLELKDLSHEKRLSRIEDIVDGKLTPKVASLEESRDKSWSFFRTPPKKS